MKKLFKTLPLALIVLSIYSCSSDDETVQDAKDNSSVVTTFTCTQENDGTTTKAALDSDCKTILWKTGDAISIFGNDNANNEYVLDSGSDGNSTGTFSGTGAETGPYVAVYPYTERATLSDDEKTVNDIVLPDEQEAVAGGFDPKAALMIATSNTTTLTFKNAVGFIKVTPQFDCKKIILRAANKDKPLAGKGKINIENPNNPYIDFTDSKELTYSITLSGEITSENAYYIAVPAGEYSGKWTLTFVTDDDNIYMRQVAKPIKFARSKALNLGKFDINGDYWVTDPRGIVSSDQEVDLGLTIEQGGKTYNVKFAKSNLTATGLAENESDFGDYFAWAATEPWLTSYTYNGSSISSRTWKIGYIGGYLQDNAPFYNGSTYTKYTRYNTDENTLEAADDAAHVILGGDWQLPTKEIWGALWNANKETVYWGSNGASPYFDTEKGMRITKIDAPSISLFLPAAGDVRGPSFYNVGSSGDYWSGPAHLLTWAYYLYFYSGDVIPQNISRRYYGFSVRPVRLVEVSLSQQ